MSLEDRYPTGHVELTSAVDEALGSHSFAANSDQSSYAVAELIHQQPATFTRTINDLDRLVITYNGEWLARSTYMGDFMHNYPLALVRSGRIPPDTIDSADEASTVQLDDDQMTDLGVISAQLPFFVELFPTTFEVPVIRENEEAAEPVESKYILAEEDQSALFQSLGTLSFPAAQVKLVLNGSPEDEIDAQSPTEIQNQTENAIVLTVYHLYFNMLQTRFPDIDIDLVRNAFIEIMPVVLGRKSPLFDASVSRTRLNLLDHGQFSGEFLKRVDDLELAESA